MLGLSVALTFMFVFVLSFYAYKIVQNIGKRYPPGPWGFPRGTFAFIGNTSTV